MAPGTSPHQAEAEAQALLRVATEVEGRTNRVDERLEARPIPRGHSVLREKYSSALVLLMLGVALLLLMICTNVGGLQSVKSFARSQESAIRMALGATNLATKPVPVLVNKTFARKFFPHADPVGQLFGVGLNQSVKGDFIVIGVVSDAKYRSLREPIAPTFYQLWDTARRMGFVLYVRTSRNEPGSIRGQPANDSGARPLGGHPHGAEVLECQRPDQERGHSENGERFPYDFPYIRRSETTILSEKFSCKTL